MNTIELSSLQLNYKTPQIDNSGSKLKEVSQDFEALLIKQMLDSMKKTINKSGMIDGGMAEDIFEDFLYEEYSKIMSKTGDFGIAKMLYNQLGGEITTI